MKYPYIYFEGKFLPIVPIQLQGKNGVVNFNAFIDTGASYSLFHADEAEVLGIKLEEGTREEMIVGDGRPLLVYVHHVPIMLAGKRFLAHIGFSKEIGVNMNIIGRRDIFDRFMICFKEYEKTIEIIPKEALNTPC